MFMLLVPIVSHPPLLDQSTIVRVVLFPPCSSFYLDMPYDFFVLFSQCSRLRFVLQQKAPEHLENVRNIIWRRARGDSFTAVFPTGAPRAGPRT